jgi:hypothetical protein
MSICFNLRHNKKEDREGKKLHSKNLYFLARNANLSLIYL